MQVLQVGIFVANSNLISKAIENEVWKFGEVYRTIVSTFLCKDFVDVSQHGKSTFKLKLCKLKCNCVGCRILCYFA